MNIRRWACSESHLPGFEHPNSSRAQAGRRELVGVSRCQNALIKYGESATVLPYTTRVSCPTWFTCTQVMAASRRSTGFTLIEVSASINPLMRVFVV